DGPGAAGERGDNRPDHERTLPAVAAPAAPPLLFASEHVEKPARGEHHGYRPSSDGEADRDRRGRDHDDQHDHGQQPSEPFMTPAAGAGSATDRPAGTFTPRRAFATATASSRDRARATTA